MDSNGKKGRLKKRGVNKRRCGKKDEEGELWKKGFFKKRRRCEQKKVWKEEGGRRVVEKREFKEKWDV